MTTASVTSSISFRQRSAQSRLRRYTRCAPSNPRLTPRSIQPHTPRGGTGSPMNRPHIMGVSVSDTTADSAMAIASTMANSWNSLPSRPPMNRIGMNTATSEMLMDTTVKPICFDPTSAACMGESPRSWCRKMFSIMTIASSTTKPTEIVSAISEKLLRLNPSRYIAPSVPARLNGTVTAAAKVGTRRRMNSATTISTSAMLISKVHSTSATLARMVVVRSEMVATRMSGGIHARSCGSAARTRSTVSMTLAPAVLVSVSRMAGFLPSHAASLVLDTLSSTSATSPSRTVAPLLVFSTSLA